MGAMNMFKVILYTSIFCYNCLLYQVTYLLPPGKEGLATNACLAWHSDGPPLFGRAIVTQF
jgi:hypothetical protein